MFPKVKYRCTGDAGITNEDKFNQFLEFNQILGFAPSESSREIKGDNRIDLLNFKRLSEFAGGKRCIVCVHQFHGHLDGEIMS